MHRVRKHMASKVAELKLGRKIIQQNVGNEGNKIVDALKDASARHTSKDKAKTLKQVTYKMAFKVKFMIDRAEITMDSAKPLQALWADTSVALLHALKPETKSPEIDDLITKIEKLKCGILEIVGGNLTKKNQVVLDEALSFYADKEFLTALLTDADFEAEKRVLYDNLQFLMALSEDPSMQLNLEVVRAAPLFSDKYSAVIGAVQTFWGSVSEDEQKELFSKVYDNLFETHPEYTSIFKSEKAQREHQLRKMFTHVITGLDQFNKLTEEIRALGTKHVALGVPKEGFEAMWKSMDNALSAIFGLRYKKQVRKSMQLVFNQLTDIMRSCYPSDESKEDPAAQVEIVQKFWEEVIKEQEQVSHGLYESLFELHPEYEDLFSGDIDELESKVFEMFKRVVMGLHDFDTLSSEMKSLGKMHLGMGVPKEGFDHMWNSLDLTLLLIFGMRYDSSVRNTLSNSFQKLIRVMQESYEE